jgi:hypothetical protein
MEQKDNRSELAFFEMYELVNSYAEKKGLATHQVVSIREVWDLAYKTGVVHATQDALAMVKATSTATE